MITEKDLLEAIAECQGERNPNAHTCIKLAAFYTILDHVTGKDETMPVPAYSFAAGPVTTEKHIEYDSGTEFSQAISGRVPDDLWPVWDELMDVLQAVQPRLYAAVLRQIDEL